MHIADLSKEDVYHVAGILQQLPHEDAPDHSRRVHRQTETLPAYLKQPKLLYRIILRSRHSCTPLCALHKGLHAGLVDDVFRLIALEVGVRMNSLIANSYRLTDAQIQRTSLLRKLHALWVAPKDYEKTFLEPASDAKWTYQKDGCKACMLAHMSGSPETLFSLRMLLLSRTRTEPKRRRLQPPLLLQWVHTWVNHIALAPGKEKDLDWMKFKQLIAENDRDADQLKCVRKKIWAERRGSKRRALKQTGLIEFIPVSPANDQILLERNESPEPLENFESEHYEDFENSIIDHYAALTSTRHLPDRQLHRKPVPDLIDVADTTAPTQDHDQENDAYPPAPLATNAAAAAAAGLKASQQQEEEVPIVLDIRPSPPPPSSAASSIYSQPSVIDLSLPPYQDYTPPRRGWTTNMKRDRPDFIPAKNWARLSRPHSHQLEPQPPVQDPTASPVLKPMKYRSPFIDARVSVADTAITGDPGWESVTCENDSDRRVTKWSFEPGVND